MDTLIALWLPIVVSTIVVFFASFLAWTVLPHHKKDWKGLPNEDAALEMIRSSGAAPGQYMLPYCSDWSELKDPAKKARYEKGPHGTIHIWPGMANMGKNMALTVMVLLIINIFIGYMVSVVFAGQTDISYLQVFQIAGTAGIMSYTFGSLCNDIWFRTPLRAVMMNTLDGVAFALLTAGIFGWLGPGVLA